MINWLEREIEDTNKGRVYPRDKITYEMVPLINEGVLVLKWDTEHPETRLWLRFAVLEWTCSDGDGKNVMYRSVFHGEGPSGNLRECRHTWWGEPDNSGYIFYPDGPLIAAALKELGKYFDGVS